MESKVSVAAKRVYDLLREQDEKIGGLNDTMVKWLLMFTYQWFGVRRATMTFNFDSTPKQIFVAPMKETSGKLSNFSPLEWHKQAFRLKWKKVERDLPGYMGLSGFTVKFCRSAPEGIHRIEPPRKQDERSGDTQG